MLVTKLQKISVYLYQKHVVLVCDFKGGEANGVVKVFCKIKDMATGLGEGAVYQET